MFPENLFYLICHPVIKEEHHYTINYSVIKGWLTINTYKTPTNSITHTLSNIIIQLKIINLNYKLKYKLINFL